MSHEIPSQVARYLDNRTRVDIMAPELVRIDEIPHELVEIGEQLRTISQTWNPVEFVTPSKESLDTEKARVFEAFDAQVEYNPVFEYPSTALDDDEAQEAEDKIRDLIRQVRAFHPTSLVGRAGKVSLYFKLKDDLASLELHAGIKEKDEVKIRDAMTSKYQGTDQLLVLTAHTMYEQLCTEDVPIDESVEPDSRPLLTEDQQQLLRSETVDAEGIRRAFEYVLGEYGILSNDGESGFRVVVTPDATSIDVRDKSQHPMTIYIPAGRKVSAAKLLELCRHEIEGHARQSMNGRRFYIGGGSLKVDDETLYEGLAKRLDEDFNKTFFGTDAGVPNPYYTLAAVKAESGASFYDIFCDQVDMQLHVLLHMPADRSLESISPDVLQGVLDTAKKRAWMYTFRVMRGHTDTSNQHSYAFAKDLAYLRGWLMDKALVDAGHGYINEAAILQGSALPLIGRFGIKESDLKYPFRDATKAYCFNVLLPQLSTNKPMSDV